LLTLKTVNFRHSALFFKGSGRCRDLSLMFLIEAILA
jgi:hypothetical protein